MECTPPPSRHSLVVHPLQCRIQGRGPGCPLPPLFLDRKKFFTVRPPSPPPPTISRSGSGTTLLRKILDPPPPPTPRAGSGPTLLRKILGPPPPHLVTQNVSIVLTNKQVLIEFSIFSHATPEIRLLSLKGYSPK